MTLSLPKPSVAAVSPKDASSIKNMSIPSNKVKDLDGFDSDFMKRAILGLTKYLKSKKNNDLLNPNGESISLTFDLGKIPPGINPKPVGM